MNHSTIAIRGKYPGVTLLTPGNHRDLPCIVYYEENVTTIEVPRLKIHSLLVLNRDPAELAP
jgi:hypothetical protein